MKHSKILEIITKKTGKTPTQQEFANILEIPKNTIGARAYRDKDYSNEELLKIGKHYNINLLEEYLIDMGTVQHTKFIEELEKFYDIVFKDYKYNGTKINIAKLNKNIHDSKRYRIRLKNTGEIIYESMEIIDSYVEKYIETKLRQILNVNYFMNFKIMDEGEIRLKPDSNFFEGKTIFKGIKISYDELLEIFKEKKLVTDLEYSMLKSNYEPVNYYNNEAVVKDGSLFENMIQDIINFDYELCLLDSKIYSSNDAIKDLEDKFTEFTGIICQLKDEISELKKEIETLKENDNTENKQIEKKHDVILL